MQKIISLFKRDYEGTRLVYDEVVPGAEWVLKGKGTATRKFDGTCCLIRNGKLYKRYTVKKRRTPPPTFEPVTEPDPMTGKQEGWVPVGNGPEDTVHREAFDTLVSSQGYAPDGTYELCGPKVQGNPEGFDQHKLIPHGKWVLLYVPLEFERLKLFLQHAGIEGIVWYHDDDGRMVKIKAKDFGIKRGRGAL